MCPPRSNPKLDRSRRGLTVLEMVISIAILSLVAVALASLGSAVQVSSDYSFGHAAATQQAKVALQRIKHHITTATASEDFPGFAVIDEVVDGWSFPDALVIWHPAGPAAIPGGPPRFDELIIYCPNPNDPTQFWELTAPTVTRLTPPLSNVSSWRTELAAIKASPNSQRVVLIETLRIANVNNSDPPRGVVRFHQRVRPSQTHWSQYKAGSRSWNNINWVQDIRGSQTGLRQSWCQIELQLIANEPDSPAVTDTIVPFFGSAALYYQLKK